MLTLTNLMTIPITLSDKKTLSIKLMPLDVTDVHSVTQVSPQLHSTQVSAHLTDAETIGLIKFGQTEPKVREMLDIAHREFRQVFDKDLSGGYNSHFGKHVCKLNWRSYRDLKQERSPS